VYTAHKAVLVYRALQDTLLGGTARKVAANAAVARSYDGIAAAATRAAEAETLAGGAGTGGAAAAAGAAAGGKGRFGLPLLLGTGGGKLATAGRLGAAGAIAYGAVEYVDPHLPEALRDNRGSEAQRYLEREYAKRQARGSLPAGVVDTSRYVDPRIASSGAALAYARMVLASGQHRSQEASALGGVFDSPFSALPDRNPDLTAARAAQQKAQQQVAAAEAALAKVQSGTGGASAAQLASAAASVAAAKAARRKRGGDDATEEARLAAAEAHLADLRGRGGVNTDKLRTAEQKLARARRTANAAAAATTKAEQGTALSVTAVLDRLRGQLGNAKNLRDDAKKLIANGVSRGVLEELDRLEKEAPGTLDKMAKGLTPAMAKQLNSQYSALQKVQQEFLTAPLRAAVTAAKAEQDRILADAAKGQAEAYRRALESNAFGSLTGPTPPPAPGDVTAHGGGGTVVLQLDGYDARQVRQVASSVVARHDHLTAVLIGSQG
jgi:hypothetical protein